MTIKSSVLPNTSAYSHLITWSMMGLCLVALAGCLGSYGSLKKSVEVTQSFNNRQMLDDYNYYYDGRETLPYAIVGIKKKYTLTSRFWTPVQPESGKFAKLVDSVYNSSLAYPHGSYILNSRGDQVGIWFSTVYRATVKFASDSEVTVFSPYSPASRSSFVGRGRY